MVTERHEYLADAWRLTELGSTWWFGKTLVWYDDAGRRYTGHQSDTVTPTHCVDSLFGENPIFTHPASHRKATRILQRTTLRLLLESLSSSH